MFWIDMQSLYIVFYHIFVANATAFCKKMTYTNVSLQKCGCISNRYPQKIKEVISKREEHWYDKILGRQL